MAVTREAKRKGQSHARNKGQRAKAQAKAPKHRAKHQSTGQSTGTERPKQKQQKWDGYTTSTGHSQKHRPKLHGEQRQKKRANRNRKRLQQKRQMQKTRSQLTLLSSQIHQALPSVGQSLPKIPGSTRRRSPPRKSLVKGEKLVRAEGEPEGRFEDTQTACPEPLRWPRLARPRRSGKRRGNAAGRKGARLARLS